MSGGDLSDFSMLDLFRVEAENQTKALIDGLLALERDSGAADQLEICMRSAHSLKGAARIIGLDEGVSVAHAMEDCFVAAQQGLLTLHQGQIDLLLKGVDLIARIANTPEAEIESWSGEKKPEIESFLASLALSLEGGHTPPALPAAAVESVEPAGKEAAAPPPLSHAGRAESPDRVLRVTAENLNRLLALAGESLVESRWLKPLADSLLRLKRQHNAAIQALESLRESFPSLGEVQNRLLECHQALSQRLEEVEMHDRRSAVLARRLYDEAVAVRMRPFADSVQGLPRMVRDLGRSLDKRVRLEIIGESTRVDRDILEKLEAPLTHLLQNAVDHGVEGPDERAALGKPEEGVIRLEARHSAGLLQITVSDDGRGIDLEKLKATVVERNLTNAETAELLSEAELLEFLFLPGFTMKGEVTQVSGRGVGLDAVQSMIKEVRGMIRLFSQAGKGTRFQLQLPLTLSVVRTLLVEIGGEPYAFPLAYIVRTLKLPKDKIEMIEGRQHFRFEGRQVGLVSAHQVLGSGNLPPGEELPVIVVGDGAAAYGLVVDRFLGERELVVQPLDSRLGKIKDISAGALTEEGMPALIVDVEDMIRSVEKLAAAGGLASVQRGSARQEAAQRKRVLVVDDSLTVRELQRKLLGNRGYDVEVAVDGMDGWNAVRTGRFNLVVTDIDMPRMDGIELVKHIKQDAHLKAMPVMIVSYKDREEDRRRGLDAGADYYLTKGSFHDETLLEAVVDLIGEAQS